MSTHRSWTDDQLIAAVKNSRSIREVIIRLGLIPAGGNYVQINYAIKNLNLSIDHFTGSRWNIGKRYHTIKRAPLEKLLVKGSVVQSFKLKNRLYEVGLKSQECEICNWSKMSSDGRIPLELDHINGDRTDNRLENLRILCPNCHSLQPTHRGLNKAKRQARVVEWYTRDT